MTPAFAADPLANAPVSGSFEGAIFNSFSGVLGAEPVDCGLPEDMWAMCGHYEGEAEPVGHAVALIRAAYNLESLSEWQTTPHGITRFFIYTNDLDESWMLATSFMDASDTVMVMFIGDMNKDW